MEWLDTIYRFVWGAPLLILLSGVGIYLTIGLRGIQIRLLPYALKLALGPPQKGTTGAGDISHFESLMTALAATVGIGNIAGVAMAITVGGPGALFWMWVTALFGMATKYGEAFLAIKYRQKDKNGEMCGGPMHFISEGLGWRWLATAFAACGAVAALGGGNMLQSNSVADVMKNFFGVGVWWSGFVIAALVGATLMGGIKSIGRVAAYLVPLMAVLYIGGGLIILLKSFDRIPEAAWSIISLAFSGKAIAGGASGSALMIAIQVGISRGLMTSEAGLGTASIAAAAARTDQPGRQALVSMTGGFLATIVMCTITALVIGVTGAHGMVGPDGELLNGAAMTIAAFQSVFAWGSYVVTAGLILFAFTTLLGWAYYGEKCVEYLFGERSIPFYRILFCLIIIPGAVLKLEVVWMVSDITNGLMAFPNLIGLAALSGVIISETRRFEQELTLRPALSS